jgi:alpha-D-xyloside xylohydrolase
MENPTDEKAYDYEDEYYFGDDLLVAPLFEENIKSRTLYLPKGKWIGMFSKNLYEGGGIVSSDNEEYPVFIRQGADFDIDRE